MKSRSILMVLALAVSVPAVNAGTKHGKQVRFAGIHPVPKSEGGGMCHIEGPHVHIYAANKLEYRMHGDDHVFVGDPVAYGWDGPKHAYKGAHPIHVEAMVGGDPDVEYCYLSGPHYHGFEPGDDPSFKVVGDAYFYVGDPPRAMIDARPQYIGINAQYKPLVYTRPVVEVDAPVGWVGARAEFVGPVVGADVHIDVPVPSIDIRIGGPAVIVRDRAPVYVVPRGKFKHKKFKGR